MCYYNSVNLTKFWNVQLCYFIDKQYYYGQYKIEIESCDVVFLMINVIVSNITQKIDYDITDFKFLLIVLLLLLGSLVIYYFGIHYGCQHAENNISYVVVL